jgi:predicted ABC-type exoprotein transport system permease subunit
MRTVSALVAVSALFLSIAFPLILGGVIFALFLFLPLFLLALVGVLNTFEERTVRQHDPSVDPRGWREQA